MADCAIDETSACAKDDPTAVCDEGDVMPVAPASPTVDGDDGEARPTEKGEHRNTQSGVNEKGKFRIRRSRAKQ